MNDVEQEGEFVDDAPPPRARRGRGAASNAGARFENVRHETVDDGWGLLDAELPPLVTTVGVDSARSVITRNDSPDIPFAQALNPYRGCEHGCIYCYARPSHAWLGLSPGLDFETRLFVKPDAARLLETELGRRGYGASPISIGSNTDPYQPVERRLRVTRAVIEVLAAHRHPFTITTKSALVERDIDLLAPLAARRLVEVYVSVTTLDGELARRLEPRATAPVRRVETIRRLSGAGIPVGVLVAPLVPALNDGEMEDVLEAAHDAGAHAAGYALLRLPLELKQLFREWLGLHAPLKAEHVMSLVRDARGGRENDSRFGRRMRGTGTYAEMIRQRFRLACRRMQFNIEESSLDAGQFRVPAAAGQLGLFEPD
jgi:DNA repair photolyase